MCLRRGQVLLRSFWRNSARIGNNNETVLIRNFGTSHAQRDVARVIIVGRLGIDPITKALPSGKEMTEYKVATNHGTGENRKTNWWTVQCFSERDQKYIKENIPKGTMVYLEGDLTTSTIEGPDGKSTKYTNIYHRSVSIVSKVRSGTGEAGEHNVVGGIVGPDGQVVGSAGSPAGEGYVVGSAGSPAGEGYVVGSAGSPAGGGNVVGQQEVQESQVV